MKWYKDNPTIILLYFLICRNCGQGIEYAQPPDACPFCRFDATARFWSCEESEIVKRVHALENVLRLNPTAKKRLLHDGLLEVLWGDSGNLVTTGKGREALRDWRIANEKS